MTGRTNIEWTEATWNPTTGCTKISSGCKFCYAEKWALMQQKRGIKQYVDGFSLTLAPARIKDPLAWKRPKLVFVNSMSDLFHDNVPTSYLKEVFNVIRQTPHQTYQILTKRIERVIVDLIDFEWPRNVWLGVSVENNDVKYRIELLKRIPAKVRFISFEPLLEKIEDINFSGIDWIIVGGESGGKARRIEYEWVQNIKDQSEYYKIPFFFKQWGKREFNPDPDDPTLNKNHANHTRGGCMVDKLILKEYPKAMNHVFTITQ